MYVYICTLINVHLYFCIYTCGINQDGVHIMFVQCLQKCDFFSETLAKTLAKALEKTLEKTLVKH